MPMSEHTPHFEPSFDLSRFGDAKAALVKALVQAGASIEEVRPIVPALEDVYLRLVGKDR